MTSPALGLLRQLSLRGSLYDANWLQVLDEYDEPPLFTRTSDVQFLSELPLPDRGQIAVKWALEVLDAHARVVSALPSGKEFFLCLTFMGWDLMESGEQAIPTPCLFASPHAADELLPGFVLVPAVSRFGQALNSWVEPLNRSDMVVAEDSTAQEVERVYLGYRSPQGFQSAGTRLRA